MTRLASLRTVRARLTLWYTAVFTGLLLIFGATAFVLLDRGLRVTVDDSLLSVARAVATSSAQPAGPNLADTIEAMLGPAFAERFFQLLDPLGRPDPRLSRGGHTAFPLSETALRNAAIGTETFETIRGPGVPAGGVRLLTLPVVDRGRLVHLVQVGMPLERVEQARARFLLVSATLAPVALAFAALGGWFLAGRALAPVDAMVAAARRIGAEDLSLRLAGPERDDELGRLANVLNEMLERLQRAFTAARQFSADAAHELRTPLTILKGELEVALHTAPLAAEYRGALESCLEEVNRLAALIEDLLFLARADADAVTLAREPVDLAALATDAATALRVLAERAAATLVAHVPPHPVIISGSAPLLFRVLFNVGENAIKYGGAGCAVDLTVHAEADRALLRVRDNGPGMAAAEQARIFDRFYRGDPARERGGTGLGLPLARSIVRLHGGDMTVESAPGQGTCFYVWLPLAARRT